MRKLFTLIKIMTRASFQNMTSIQGLRSKKNDKKLKHFGKRLLIIFLMLYLIVIIYVPSYYITKELIRLGQPSLTISLLYSFAPILILFFGILSIPGVFYFSKDIEDYLPLPLTSQEIIMGKFITAYLQNLLTVLFFFLPVYINYFLLVKPELSFILTSMIALLFIPLIPLSISLLIVAILMRLVPFLKNKDLYVYISTGLIFIPTFIIVFAMSLSNCEIDMFNNLIQSVQNMDDSLFRHLNLFFPTSQMFTLGVLDFDILKLLLAMILSILGVVLTLFLIGPLYFASVIGIDEKSSKKRRLRLSELDQGTNVKTFTQSFILKDFKNIIRTPTFAINYFSFFIIMPLMMFIIPLTQKQGIGFLMRNLDFVSQEFHQRFYSLKFMKQIDLPLLAGLGFGIVLSNFEASSSTAISREGHAFKDYLALPINLSDIAHAKGRLSFLISSVYASIIFVLAIIILKPKLLTMILFLFTSVIGILISTYLSLYVDVLFPSLNWETEQQAVKGNFIQMLVILPLMIVPILFFALSFTASSWINIVITLLIAPILLFILIKQTTKASNTKLLNRIQNL